MVIIIIELYYEQLIILIDHIYNQLLLFQSCQILKPELGKRGSALKAYLADEVLILYSADGFDGRPQFKDCPLFQAIHGNLIQSVIFRQYLTIIL